jgi:hypothetical protein
VSGVVEPDAASERLHRAMFSTAGIVDTLLAPIVFVIAYRAAGLDAALIGAGTLALAVVAWRALRRQETTSAWYGVAGVALAVALAKATGSSDGFFLPKAASNLLYGGACLVSVLVGKPLVGVAWAFFQRQPIAWGYRPEVRRVFSALTLLWASAFFVRLVALGVLIADERDRTGALAAVSIGLGLPLTALLVAVTLLVIRRRLGPLAQPAPAPNPL